MRSPRRHMVALVTPDSVPFSWVFGGGVSSGTAFMYGVDGT